MRDADYEIGSGWYTRDSIAQRPYGDARAKCGGTFIREKKKKGKLGPISVLDRKKRECVNRAVITVELDVDVCKTSTLSLFATQHFYIFFIYAKEKYIGVLQMIIRLWTVNFQDTYFGYYVDGDFAIFRLFVTFLSPFVIFTRCNLPSSLQKPYYSSLSDKDK